MDIDYAIKLLHKDTSAQEIINLEYYAGFSYQQVTDKINEAIELLCNIARKYQHLEEIKEGVEDESYQEKRRGSGF